VRRAFAKFSTITMLLSKNYRYVPISTPHDDFVAVIDGKIWTNSDVDWKQFSYSKGINKIGDIKFGMIVNIKAFYSDFFLGKGGLGNTIGIEDSDIIATSPITLASYFRHGFKPEFDEVYLSPQSNVSVLV